MKQIRYMREEAKGSCSQCPRDNVDLVRPYIGRPGGAGPMTVGMEPVRWSPGATVIARHLVRIEEYGPRGATPKGFCPGSLNPAREVPKPPERAKQKR